jgi:hypothetical protein
MYLPRKLKRVLSAFSVNVAAAYFFVIPATRDQFLLINDIVICIIGLYAAYKLEEDDDDEH